MGRRYEKKRIHNYQLAALRRALTAHNKIVKADACTIKGLAARGFVHDTATFAFLTVAGFERAKLKAADYCVKRDGQPFDPSMMEDLT